MRTMNIGKLNKRITIQQEVDEVNEIGQHQKVMQDVKTVWGTVTPVRGSEFYDAQKLTEEETYKFFIRYLPDITADMFISCQGKLFQMKAIIDVDFEHKMLEIHAVERVKKVYDE